MKSFGSYGGETVIDFEDINSGLYLIRGNTGAGKTTIFDAVVFALYGESSGGKRTLAMMHSDFVDFSVPTEIELTFEHNGGVHTVSRKQAFTHHDDGSYSPRTPDAELLEEGKTVVKGVKKVTPRITELLGLNAEQFGQIVMLAQGEFRKFLEADSEGRCKILSNIFDTTKYKALSERLDRARAKLEAVRTRDAEAVRLLIQNMELPVDIPAETAARLKPVDPKDGRVLRSLTFEEDMKAWIDEENKRASELESTKNICTAERERLMESKAAAEHQNQRLDALDAVRRQFEELMSHAAEMDEKSVWHDKGARALAVRIEEEKLRDSVNSARKARSRVEDLEGREHECAEAASRAAQAAAACEEDRALAVTRGNKLAQLQETLPDYVILSNSASRMKGWEKRAQDLTKELKIHRDQIGEITSRLEVALAEIADLGEIDAETERTRLARIDAEALCRRFSEIRADVEQANRDSSSLTINRKELLDLDSDALREHEAYDRTYRCFISGQAALLAADLHREIKEKGEARCPVCGVLHTRESGVMSRTELFDGQTSTQKDVDNARAKSEEADRKRRDKENAVNIAEAKLLQKQEGIVQKARELPSCESITWEELSKETVLSLREENYAENLRRCHEAEREAFKKSERRNSLRDLTADLIQRRQKENQAERDAGEQAAQATAQCEGLRATVATLRGKLAFENESLARAEIERLSISLNALKSRISAIDQAKIKADRYLAEIQASKTTAEDVLARTEETLADCRMNYASALKKEGYADESSYRADAELLPQDTVEAQRMLADLARELAAYRERRDMTVRQRAELEKETESFVRRDLADVENAYAEATSHEKDAANQYAAYVNLISSQHKVLENISNVTSRLRGTDDAMGRIKSLSSLANGDIGSGSYRLDFERYMLGDCLREVLYQANVRLDKMSGGRYELVHRTSGRDRQTVAGLDIDILDHNTGRQRMAETISGGEGFMASMSLALGLADVVRNHAGNVQLDSTFIDEGFGSLDEDVLRKCLDVLKDLVNGARQVGIISHVPELESNVWPQIVVTSSGRNGSTVRIEKR